MNQNRYSTAMILSFVAFGLFSSALAVGLYYPELQEFEQNKLASLSVWAPIAALYNLGGLRAVLALACLLLLGGVAATLGSVFKFRALRAEIGDEAYEQTKLENARSLAAWRRRMPAHLESREAAAAYQRRIRRMFAVLGLVVAAVVVAVLMGWVN